MGTKTSRLRGFDRIKRVILLGPVMLACIGLTVAGEREWIFRFEPVYMNAYGHDQHVLTIHQVDNDATPPDNEKLGVNLDTDSGLAYRGEFIWAGERWSLGLDMLWFSTAQISPDRTAAAEGPAGTIDQVAFEIADRQFVSSDPAETLYYQVLEDTDLTTWTVDLYGMRTVTDRPDTRIGLLFGIRSADFDNDYRAVAGIEGVEGAQLDASSNYDRMTGPVIGLTGEFRRGNSRISGQIGQSILFGTAELTSMQRGFTGPFSETPAYDSREKFGKLQDVAIPVTEFRMRYSYDIGRHIAVGAGINGSVWVDVPVPPGVVPMEDGTDVLHENTIVFFGMSVSGEFRF